MSAAGIAERGSGRSVLSRGDRSRGGAGRREFEQLDREVRNFVTERPVLAVALALTAGYVVGRIVSRI